MVPYDNDNEPPLDNNNKLAEPKKEIELQERLVELKNDHIKSDSMVRLYKKDKKNSSELSLTDDNQTYPSGLAASQQASPSGTLTGISKFQIFKVKSGGFTKKKEIY